MFRHWAPVEAHRNQQEVPFESKEHSMAPRIENLPGETARQKNVPWRAKLVFPHCGLFSLELKLPPSNSQILLFFCQKINVLYPSLMFILVQRFISSVSRMTAYTWSTCSCRTYHPSAETEQEYFFIAIAEPLGNTEVMELFIHISIQIVFSEQRLTAVQITFKISPLYCSSKHSLLCQPRDCCPGGKFHLSGVNHISTSCFYTPVLHQFK